MNTKSSPVVDAARELLKSYGYFIDNLWHVDDIHFICEQKNLQKLSNHEAMEVFVIANENFDGETGISWPQLENSLHAYLQRKAILSELMTPDKA